MDSLPISENEKYKNHFNGRRYLETFYAVDPKNQEINSESKFLIKFLNKVFSSGRVKGESLIEIGAGPCLQHVLAASEHFEKIIITDYLQDNLQEIEKWLRNSSDAFDWSPFLRYLCALPNNIFTPEDKAEEIRRKVFLMKCDFTKNNPLQPNILSLADCVLTVGCLICASQTIAEFETALKNTTSLVKPGGHLIFIDYFGATYYMVGKEKFLTVTVDEHVVKEAVGKSGCEMEEFHVFEDLPYEEDTFDCKKVFCIVARKL